MDTQRKHVSQNRRFSFYGLHSDCSDCADIHRVDIAAPHILCDVVHIVVSLGKRDEAHDHAIKSPPMYTAYAIAYAVSYAYTPL